MTDALALLAVAAIGYFTLLDIEPNTWFHDRLQTWFGGIRSVGVVSPTLAWLAAVGLPAVVVGLLSILLSNVLVNFIFDVVILMLTTAMATFMTNHRSLLRAVYANDAALAAKIANSWERRDADVVDSSDKFVTRMLGLCVARLHEDVLAVILWYVLLGPAGAVFSTAHVAFERYGGYSLPTSKYFNWVSSSVTIVLLGVCGNMAPALSTMPSFNVERAALAASGNHTEAMDLEKVPDFGKLLLHTGLLGVVGGAIIITLLLS